MFLREETTIKKVFHVLWQLIMRFYQGEDSAFRTKPCVRGRKRKPLWCPCQVDHHQVNRCVGWLSVQSVRSFPDIDSGIISQLPFQHSVASFDRDHRGRTPFQQAVRESSDIATEIGACESLHPDLEFLDGVVEFRARA